MYRDGAARKVLGDRDFVFGDELTRENLLKIAVTADEIREVNVYKVCVQPLDGSEFTVHVDVAACRISDLKSQICGGSELRLPDSVPDCIPLRARVPGPGGSDSNPEHLRTRRSPRSPLLPRGIFRPTTDHAIYSHT